MNGSMRCLILTVLFGAVFFPVFPGLVRSWFSSPDSSHGLLVLPVAIYLVWSRRQQLADVEFSSSGWGLSLLVVSLLAYLLALVGGISFVARVMLVFSLMGLVLYLYGGGVFRTLLFPLAFLLFMVPVPVSVVSLVSLPLQSFATAISASLIRFCSIPVLREGNMLFFVQTQLEVAEACSGIRSIVAMVMLSSLFVYFSRHGRRVNVILLCSAIPIAMLANIMRISGTGVLAHFFGDQVARGFLHEFSGMAVFIFGLLVLWLEFLLLTRLFGKTGDLGLAAEGR